MNVDLLTRRSFSLFAAVGGWRTVAEAVASRALFLVAYLVTGQVGTSALVAVGGVAVCAVARLYTDRRFWPAAIPLAVVGASAALAGSTGQGVDFYLLDAVRSAAAATVFLVSLLVRWPVIGIAVATARGQGSGWRRDSRQRRRYAACTCVFLAKFALATAILTALYLAGQVTALGIASVLLGTPALGACAYACWRILRDEPVTHRVSVPDGRNPA